MSVNPYQRLEKNIAYQFQDKTLLELALTHRSHKGANNERVEFLGDAILGLVIAQQLYETFPKAKEGQLSRLRSRLVKGVTLAEIAKEFDVGEYLRLGPGELKSGGYRRESILADALESLIGAIYLDSDHATVQEVVLGWYQSRLTHLTLEHTEKDPKTRLQEYLQSLRKTLPLYEVVSTVGEAHDQTFHVICRLPDMAMHTEGVGLSRRYAEQEAARQALVILEAGK